MEMVQGWFSGLVCCSNLMAKEATTVEEVPVAYTVTCFDESDTELRDIRVHHTHQWKDMQCTITEIYGSPAMFAYDDGSGLDWPVRNQAEWEKFLDILMTEKLCHGEYDILLLPANGWDRYNEQQQRQSHGHDSSRGTEAVKPSDRGAQDSEESVSEDMTSSRI
jgi:hypothetical protein